MVFAGSGFVKDIIAIEQLADEAPRRWGPFSARAASRRALGTTCDRAIGGPRDIRFRAREGPAPRVVRHSNQYLSCMTVTSRYSVVTYSYIGLVARPIPRDKMPPRLPGLDGVAAGPAQEVGRARMPGMVVLESMWNRKGRLLDEEPSVLPYLKAIKQSLAWEGIRVNLVYRRFYSSYDLGLLLEEVRRSR